MKKILALTLAAALCLGTVSSLASCKILGKKATKSGTEAAKLLLANERLDEDAVGKKIDVGMSFLHDDRAIGGTSDGGNKSSVIAASLGAKTWSDFPAHNSSMYQFESFFINIDNRAINVASDIGYMKDKIGIVDKWVGPQMLRVYESRDVLVATSENEDNIYYRYTDENANNVYEMYFFSEIEQENATGSGKMVLVPGERYEFYYDHSAGFRDYVIMENSRGYWMCTRFNYFEDPIGNGVNFFPTVIKDGLAYTAHVSMRANEGDGKAVATSYSVVDADSGRELVTADCHDQGVNFTVHLSGIKSGLVSVSADEYYSSEDGYYASSAINQLVTSNGSYFAKSYPIEEGTFNFTGGHVDYDGYLQKQYGMLTFTYCNPGATLEDGLAKLEEYLSACGLTLYRSFDELGAALNHAALLGDNFGDSFEWNGYTLGDITKVESAMKVLHADYEKASAEIEEVRHYEKVEVGFSKLSLPSFAELGVALSGANNYSDGKITLSEIKGAVSDEALLESGKEYVLRVALSLCDEKGNPVSTNTVPLSGGNASAVTFSEGALSLTVSGDFNVPKNLAHGNYAVVVYAATADEGIRVTELKKIASFSASENKLDSAAMDIDISVKDENLYVKYSIKNSFKFDVTSTKATYTYSEIEHIILIEVIKKGTPHQSAKLEYADGKEIGRNESLGKGSYRLMCYLPTADGMAESYVYLNLK